MTYPLVNATVHAETCHCQGSPSLLRERAASYLRDADVLEAAGDDEAAEQFREIARRLGELGEGAT